MPLTLEEQERRAYIDGRVGDASMVSLAIDAENDALDEMRHERDVAKEEADDLYKKNEQLQEDIEAAEEKALTLTSQLENALDENKALQGQIHEAGIDLL